MTASRHRWWLLGLPLLLVQTTGASQVAHVGYVVARMPLEGLATDRIRLEVGLYSDGECATRPVKTVTTTLHDLRADALSRSWRERGHPRPRNTVDLTVEIRGITSANAPFVEITGPGIVPAGSRCQQWHRPGIGDLRARAMALRERMHPPPLHTAPNGTRSLLEATRAGPAAR